MKVFSAVLFATLSLSFSFGFANDQIIIKLRESGNKAIQDFFAKNSSLERIDVLSKRSAIFLVSEPRSKNIEDTLSHLRANPEVLYAQPNHRIDFRRAKLESNDPRAKDQWNFNGNFPNADIKVKEAWNLGQGGTDLNGKDVAVAVVDGGVDINHEDLKSNIWINSHEIANNAIDDDGNGYKDDVNGYNTYNDHPNIAADYHGTHVAGIIGAQGGNSLGLVGVNWKVKVVPVQVFSDNFNDPFTEADMVKAYTYVIAVKEQWLNTQGAKGVNIVATNSSFGVDYADCNSAQYAVWNDMYNEMGKLGITSAVATANNNVDVDAQGDVPSGCNSAHIVSVTNTNSSAKKETYAGYGLKTVDLGAPGKAILSTYPTNGYQQLSGTSMATPHVAGAIAFLHSVANQNYLDLYSQDPLAASVKMAEIVVTAVTPQLDLQGKTVSGGRLNLALAAQKIQSF